MKSFIEIIWRNAPNEIDWITVKRQEIYSICTRVAGNMCVFFFHSLQHYNFNSNSLFSVTCFNCTFSSFVVRLCRFNFAFVQSNTVCCIRNKKKRSLPMIIKVVFVHSMCSCNNWCRQSRSARSVCVCNAFRVAHSPLLDVIKCTVPFQFEEELKWMKSECQPCCYCIRMIRSRNPTK